MVFTENNYNSKLASIEMSEKYLRGQIITKISILKLEELKYIINTINSIN